MNTDRLPASVRIAACLKEKIEARIYGPGEWLPTERDLASSFSADRATIRAALALLAEDGLVVREPRRRPMVTPAQHQEPNGSIRHSPRSSLKTIAAIIPQPRNYPALSLIQRGILRVLRHRGAEHQLIVLDNQGDTWAQSVAMERHALEVIEREAPAGAILWSIGSAETEHTIAKIQNRRIPMVLLDRHPENLACDFVGVDNRAAARDAVTHLLDLGHVRIAHLTSHGDLTTVREREEGYREALLARGITPSEDLICRVADHDDLYPEVGPLVERLLRRPDRPTALFALKDILAHAFIAEAAARGIRVPEDISVFGFDDHDRHSLQPAMLTTVHQPFEQMGEKAAELLLRRIKDPAGSRTPFQHVLVPTPLVIRSSCRRLSAAETPRVPA